MSDAPGPGPAANQPTLQLWQVLQRLLTVPVTDLTASLQAATDGIAAVLGADKVDAFLLEPSTQTLVARGTSATAMGRRQRQLGLDRLPLANGGRTVSVFQTQQPHRDGHVDEDPEELSGVKAALGVRSTLAAPLTVGAEARGVLLVSSAQPERFSAADLAGVVVIAHWLGLVAERAQLVEQAGAERQAAEQAALRRTLVAAVSHNLLTPLAIIKGHADNLHDSRIRSDPQLAEEALFAINDEAERLRRQIGNLLDMSRVASGGLSPLLLGMVELPALVARLVQRFTGRSRRHRFVSAVPADLPRVVAERDRLEAVFHNLLDNAMKYSPRGGVVTIRARQDGAVVECSVEDEGIGIEPRVLGQLFAPYYRAATAPGMAAGTGLGLYISKLITEAHGGRIWVESELGRGTAVHFTIPTVGGPDDSHS